MGDDDAQNEVHQRKRQLGRLEVVCGDSGIKAKALSFHRNASHLRSLARKWLTSELPGGSLHMAVFYRTIWKMFLIRNQILNKWPTDYMVCIWKVKGCSKIPFP